MQHPLVEAQAQNAQAVNQALVTAAAPAGGEAVAAAGAASGYAARDDDDGVKKRKRGAPGAAKIESQIVEQRLKINIK